MKKYVTAILFTAILLTVFAFGFFANAEELSVQKAQDVLTEANDLRSSIGFLFRWFDEKSIDEPIALEWSTGWGNVIEKGFVKVRAGYDAESVKYKIREVFSKEYAEDIINSSTSFFNKYRTKDGESYFIYERGMQLLNYGDNPTNYFTENDIKNIKIVSQNEKNATVAIHGNKRPVGNILPDSCLRLDGFRITVDFVYENGSWKISGGDYSGMIFSVDNADLSGDFTADTAKDCITAAIYDLYYYTVIDPISQLDTSGIDCSEYYGPNGPEKVELEGNLAEKSTWENFAKKYLADSVSDKLLDFSIGLSVVNDKICFNGYKQGSDEPVYEFDLEYIKEDNIRILRKTADEAVVVYKMSYPGRIDVELPIKFKKYEDGWKISDSEFIDILDEHYGVDRTHENATTGDVFIVPAFLIVFCICSALFSGKKTRRKIAV